MSHGIGLVASLAAAPFLIGAMLRRGDAMLILAAGIFAVTVVLLYLSSTLYHAIPESRAKRVLQVIDHSAIYLLIAGHLHSLCARRAPRALGMDAADGGMAARGARRGPQDHQGHRLAPALHRALPGDGMARAGGSPAFHP